MTRAFNAGPSAAVSNNTQSAESTHLSGAGLFTDLPPASRHGPTNGIYTTAYTTDFGVVYSNGTAWVGLATAANTPFSPSAAGLPAGVPADVQSAIQALVRRAPLATPYEYGYVIGASDAANTVAMAAWAASKRCSLPPDSTFRTTATVNFTADAICLGNGSTSVIFGVGISGPVVKIGDGTLSNTNTANIGNFNIGGSTCTRALDIDGALLSKVEDIRIVNATAFTDGYTVQNFWGSSFKRIYTNGASVSGKDFNFGNGVNSCSIDLLYTSDFSTYNFFFQTSSGTSTGNNLGTLVAQGGQTGLYVGAGYSGLSIPALYTENCVKPIVLGDSATSKLASGVEIVAAALLGPNFVTNPHPQRANAIALVEFNYATGCNVRGGGFAGSTGINSVCSLTITGSGGGSGAIAYAYVNAGGVVFAEFLVNGGSGYSGTITVTVGGNAVGKGVTYTATQSTGIINLLTRTGSGSAITPVPFPIAYKTANRCTVDSAGFNSGQGLYSSLFPWMLRLSGADSGGGITIRNDIAIDTNGNLNAVCDVQKMEGFGYYHAYSWRDGGGSPASRYYQPIQFVP